MNTGQMATILVSVLVCGVLIAGMLPIFGSVSASEDTLTNEGYFTMDPLDDGTHTLYWDHTVPKAVSVDGVELALPDLDYSKAYTIFGGNNFMLRLVSGGVQLFGPSGTAFIQATINTGDMNVEIGSGSAVFTANVDTESATTVTVSLDEAYIINAKGDGQFTMKYANESAMITKDSSIITMIGTSRTYASNDLCLYASGTIDDGIEPITFRGDTYPATFSELEYTLNEVDDYIGLYDISKIEFTVTQNGEDYDLTYSYFLVPTEVTAERSVHMSDVMSTIIQLVPLLAVVGLVLATIGYVLYKRL